MQMHVPLAVLRQSRANGVGDTSSGGKVERLKDQGEGDVIATYANGRRLQRVEAPAAKGRAGCRDPANEKSPIC